MRSPASDQTTVGDGSVAPGREQRICQAIKINTKVINGGRRLRGAARNSDLTMGISMRGTWPATVAAPGASAEIARTGTASFRAMAVSCGKPVMDMWTSIG
jgi:hypothetical protein